MRLEPHVFTGLDFFCRWGAVTFPIPLQSLTDKHLDTLSGRLVHNVTSTIQHATLGNNLHTFKLIEYGPVDVIEIHQIG